MDPLDRNTILDMIGAGRGPQDGVWIPLPFVEWMGSYESAAMLNQFFFYRDLVRRDGRDEFYMSYDQWRAKLFLTERQVRNGLERLRAVGIRTRAARDPHGNRVLFYSLDADAFLLAYQAFLSGRSAQNVPAETDDPSEPPSYNLYDRIYTEESTEESNRESAAPAPAPDPQISNAPPPANGHIGNGHLVGYDIAAPQSKGARPLAEETPPPVTVKVPPGTAVNRRPDAPPRQPRPRKAPIPANWQPPPEYATRAAAEYPQLSAAQREAALQQFRHHYEASQEPYANWGAKYLEWLHHEVHTFARAPGKGAPPAGPAPPAYFTPDPFGGRRP
jgi:hypothetical protein